MSNPHVPLFSVATVNDDVLSETTNPDLSFDYVDISSISDFKVSDSLARSTFREAPSRARRLAQPGDIALSTVRTYLRAIAPITEQHADSVFSTGFAIIRPNPSVCNPAFLRYATLSNEFIDSIASHSNGVSYPAINATDIMRFRIPLPPLDTQQRIADYLDRETTQIDTAVADLDRYVELLEKRRSAMVTKMMTHDSHTQHASLHTVAAIPLTAGLGLAGGRSNPDEARYIRITDIGKHGGLRDDIFASQPHNLVGDSDVQKDDLLLAAAGSVGKSYLHTEEDGDFCYAGYLVRFRPDKNKVSPRYVHHWTHSSHYWDQVLTSAVTSTIMNVSASRYSNLKLPLPDLGTQREIADYLDTETARIDALITESTQLRDLLLKRRSVLITEVVTGRKQV